MMQYRKDRHGENISILGYGCMRFTGTAGIIDVRKAEKEVMAAIDKGVNYFDTAYIYPGSEAALGEILQRNHCRDQVKIATKLPHYLIKSPDGMEKYFREELKRLRTDHVDYYLMHMLSDVKTWNRLKEMRIENWIAEKKASGEIRNIGFSYHGNSDMFIQLVDAYDWDFVQIQYNYLDVNSQAGVTGLQYAHQKGLPVIIMEPLRGGKLVNGLPDKALRLMKHYEEVHTPAEWAFRWLYNQPEVTCVLSGMNSMEMVEENIRTAEASAIGCLTEKDSELLKEVVSAINEKMKVGCTGCRYCMPCPKKVDIPGIFSAYNHRYTEGKFSGLFEYMMCTTLRKEKTGASNCVECGLCESHCPQHIEIRRELKNAKADMEGPLYRIASRILPIFMKY